MLNYLLDQIQQQTMNIKEQRSVHRRIAICILIYFLGFQYAFAQNFANNKELLDIIKTATERIAQEPNNAFYFGVRATAYYDLGELNMALTDINKAIQLDCNDWELHYNKGVVLNDLGKIKAAITAYTNAIKLNNQKSEVFFGRASSFYKLDQYLKAIDDYTRAIILNKTNPDAYYNRALCYNHIEEYGYAINDYSVAISLSPESSKFYYNRGYARFKADSIDIAITDFKKTIALDSTNVYGYYYLSLVYKKIGRNDDFNYNYNKAKENGLPKHLYLRKN